MNRNDAFWKLIDELEEAVVFRETQQGGDGWHYDQAGLGVAEVRSKLWEWLERVDDEKADAVAAAVSDVSLQD